MASSETRKVDRGSTEIGTPVGQDADGVWHVRSNAACRAVLRSTDTAQAGLGIETMDQLPQSIRRPVLYRDGPEHREHRRQTARYFTAKRVEENYRGLMERVTDEQLAILVRDGSADLAKLSFALAVEVAATVVGLTNSTPAGLAARLERFFPEKFGQPGFTSLSGIYWFCKQIFQFWSIYRHDVRPAVAARRRQPQDDLITHLIAEGCHGGEILGECVTFGAAGMITTREFINMAAWHLFTDPDLRRRYLDGDQEYRYAVLHEILRLEPVVGNLFRRTVTDITVPGADGPVTIPAGAKVDVAIAAANVDPDAVGDDPASLCPARPVAEGTGPQVLSFGDGPHKCAGMHLAIQESDVFLTRLFRLPGISMRTAPRININPAIYGYELRGMIVTVS